ncbi:tricarballylate utilization 4Fe-4S protein TcuB [Azospirillum brasilense]|uniref:tricarballylate utilization 4Fe-4S protein TcuB n=1 Tax=Azospirillum brasilense TaxID=192 RepID=UPI001FFFA73A|nr:tricarballylate utilization 4Fe-4S protein TcuB [Azospirillum brasilense]
MPASLARVRWQSYEEHAWPSALRGLFRSNCRTIAWLSLFIVGLTVALTVGIVPAEALFRPHHGPGAFYAVIPWGAMAGLAGTTLGWSVLALAMGARSFWRATGGGTPRALGRALGDALALRNLGGGGIGCAEGENGFSPWRRRFHHALFYGIGLCAAATAVATVYDHVFGWEAPYSRFSVPVVLGSLGGLGMVIGAIGLLHLKDRADRAPTAVELQGADRAFLHLLWLTATSGLALMALRGTAAMGLLLAVHLGTVLAVFVALPYSRFVHSVYRVSALVHAAMEGGRVER